MTDEEIPFNDRLRLDLLNLSTRAAALENFVLNEFLLLQEQVASARGEPMDEAARKEYVAKMRGTLSVLFQDMLQRGLEHIEDKDPALAARLDRRRDPDELPHPGKNPSPE